ncbi:S-layer homology domain-containing protein [Peptoniphilus sp. MSJ-1]|uniref:S-layer homology domain-containing protein n=1 Tax=Peptoniphilus ovalis TaxID=2841503 RepID=A0ABS6FI09_9FIRM|nr:S-layer homology domain-containing protein [Peptoniphilus ovalis]
MKKIFLSILLFSLLTINVFAAEDIQVVLEQPAVSQAKSGDVLKYNLVINLPKNFKEKYSSFSVTLLLDKSLDVEKTKMVKGEEVKGKLDVRTTTIKGKGQNIVTVNANDLSIIKDNELNLEIQTKVKEDVTNSNLKNSFVISYVDKGGDSKSDQKNLESSTKTQNGVLKIKDVYTDSKSIIGQTEKNANVRIAIDRKVYDEIKADKNGNFEVAINNLKEGTLIRIVSETKDKNAALEYIVKPKVEANKSKELVKEDNSDKTENKNENNSVVNNKEENYTDIYSTIKSLEKLNDYVDFAKNLSTAKATNKNEKRLKAAIASAEYVIVKTEVSTEEIEKSLDELTKSINIVRRPYMTGISEKKFAPNEKITRAQAASVLKRIIDPNAKANDSTSFRDVKKNAWYYDDIVFIEKRGLISGYEDGTFKPENAMTRAQFAHLINNYLKLEEGNNPMNFSDVKKNHWASKAINTLSSHGIMVGDKNKFNPDKNITRAEAATIFNKILDRKINESFLDKYAKNTFEDVNRKQWFYYQVLEITAK